jgi:hypothetical protein
LNANSTTGSSTFGAFRRTSQVESLSLEHIATEDCDAFGNHMIWIHLAYLSAKFALKIKKLKIKIIDNLRNIPTER